MELSSITSTHIVRGITSLAKDRFVITENEDLEHVIQETAPESLNDKSFITLKRNSSNSIGERILLIAVLSSEDETATALKWAAAVKDELLEPKNGDLYIFIVIKDYNLSIEQCIHIESSDRICRRYVLRPKESIGGFLSRSFIGSVMSNSTTARILDPLHLALTQTLEKHPKFDYATQQAWREALLSGKSGSDLIDVLFKLQ